MTDATVVQKPYPDPIEVPEWFTHKDPPTPEQAVKYKQIHDQARAMAELLIGILPLDRYETVMAFTQLEECVYWAVTAVSRS